MAAKILALLLKRKNHVQASVGYLGQESAEAVGTQYWVPRFSTKKQVERTKFLYLRVDFILMEIPQSISTIAIKASMVSYFISEKGGKRIAVIKKRMPYYWVHCCEHRDLEVYLDMKPRGGILLDRKLNYARAEGDVIKGYLVFERKGSEWVPSNREPEAFFHFIFYKTDMPTDCRAEYEVVSTKNVFAFKTVKDCNHGYSGAAVFFIASTKGAEIEYRMTYDYGGCRWLYEKVRVAWNNGEPLVEKVEELKRVI